MDVEQTRAHYGVWQLDYGPFNLSYSKIHFSAKKGKSFRRKLTRISPNSSTVKSFKIKTSNKIKKILNKYWKWIKKASHYSRKIILYLSSKVKKKYFLLFCLNFEWKWITAEKKEKWNYGFSSEHLIEVCLVSLRKRVEQIIVWFNRFRVNLQCGEISKWFWELSRVSSHF